MLAVRVIPCLDVDAGRVVKGVRFVEIRDAGDPVELAARYDAEGADELVFLDITASSDDRDTMVHVVERVADEVFIPFTVGGGIRTRRRRAPDAARRRRQGVAEHRGGERSRARAARAPTSSATSASSWRSTPAAATPTIPGAGWEVVTHGGRTATGLDAVEWAVHACDLGAGEILLTSMDRDGTKVGYDLDLLRAVGEAVDVPVIASGGVGTLEHLCAGRDRGRRDRAARGLDLPFRPVHGAGGEGRARGPRAHRPALTWPSGRSQWPTSARRGHT